MILVERAGSQLKLTHDFMLEEIVYLRSLPVRRFDPATKAWMAAPTRANKLHLDTPVSSVVVQWTPEAVAMFEERHAKAVDETVVEFPPGFRFVTKSRPYQLEALRLLQEAPAFALSLPPGSGKTKLYLEDMEVQVLRGIMDGALFMCPNSIKNNLSDEMKLHAFMEFDTEIYSPTKKAKIRQWIGTPSARPKVLVMATETLSSGDGYDIATEFLKTGPKGFYLDESSRVKTHGAERTKMAIKLGRLAAVKRVGTGTMILKGLVDAWAQYQVLSPDIFGQSFFAFRNRYAKMGGYKAKQVTGDMNVDEFMEVVRPFTYCRLKADILPDLPEKVPVTRTVEMSKEQKRLYTELKNSGLTLTEMGSVSYTTALVRELRLQQITGGFIGGEIVGNDQDGIHYKKEASAIPGPNPKFDEVEAILDDMEGKVVIWARFIPEIRALAERLRKRGINCVTFTGQGMTDDEREASKVAFRDDPTVRCFIGQSRTGGIGLNGLTVAQVSIYLSNDFSLETRIQSEDRTHRIGQDGMTLPGDDHKSILYIDILTDGGNDNDIYQALRAGKDYTAVINERMKAC